MMSRGNTCALFSCTNGSVQIEQEEKKECEIHNKPLLHEECPLFVAILQTNEQTNNLGFYSRHSVRVKRYYIWCCHEV